MSQVAVITGVLERMHSGAGAIADSGRVKQACEIAAHAYGDRMHWSGETLLEHVAGVLENLRPFEPDEDAVIACILYHILLSEDWTLTALEEQFGPKVRSLVSGTHLLSHVTVSGRRGTIEDLRLMLLTVSDDMRTVLINLCDRCHLLQRIDAIPSEERRQLCQDVLNLFAPVAARLGIYSLKHELESRAFPVLYPTDAELICGQVEDLHRSHGVFLKAASDGITAFLRDGGITAAVLFRQKQPYSLFIKMKQKALTNVRDVSDFYAVRVIVSSVEECYQALGLLHQLGRPVANRFKDYISFPKPNGYQSLHTTLAQLPSVPDDVLVEVQVRTQAMHRESELGIAAHWSYKTYGDTDLAAYHAQLHQMLMSQESVAKDGTSRLVDQIFVLTPKGDVFELPEGATPLDFAFLIHTDVGLSFKGARVNGAMVSSGHALENGDIVEILRHKSPQPSPQWLQTLTLSSSRSKLKRYLYSKQRPQLVAIGRSVFNDELKRHGLPVLDNDLSILRVHQGSNLGTQQREDLLLKVGQGAEKPSVLLSQLDLAVAELRKRESAAAASSQAEAKTDGAKYRVELQGGFPMPVQFAKCCKAENDRRSPIVGVVSRSGVVMVHRSVCGMLKNANPERTISAQWRRL